MCATKEHYRFDISTLVNSRIHRSSAAPRFSEKDFYNPRDHRLFARGAKRMEVIVSGNEQIQADVVFVHGLRGDRIKTWQKDKIIWPRDLLPQELPNARIMSYGYDADVMHFFKSSSQSSIFNHSINLLEDLQRKRRTAEEKKRPIIFVGHSLGGLVIKDALCRSNEYKASGRNPRAAAIIGSTYGIAFLGTPHRGGNHTTWAKIATNLATMILKDHNALVIDSLTRGSKILERLQDSFCGIIGHIQIFSFFEDLAYASAGKIVDDDSATLGLACERKQWIPANHSDMCKFKNRTDHGYIRVAGGISDLVEDAIDNVASRNTSMEVPNLPIHQKPNVDLEPTIPRLPTPQALIGHPDQSQAVSVSSQAQKRGWNRSVTPEKANTGADQKADSDNLIKARVIPTDSQPLTLLSINGFHPSNKASAIRALLWACEEGHLCVVKYLLASEADGEPIREFVATERRPLNIAASKGHGSIIETLFSYSTNTDGYGVGMTSLHAAAYNDQPSALETLLSLGAHPDERNSHGETALMQAAIKSTRCLKELIKAGAKVNLQDKFGRTALVFAIKADTTRLNSEGRIRLLLNAGADVDVQDFEGRTALMHAILRGSKEAVSILLGAGANVNLKAPDGETALRCAIEEEKEEIVSLLLEAGADVKQPISSVPPSKYAENMGFDDIADLLLECELIREYEEADEGMQEGA